MFRNFYDSEITLYSPEGRLLQLEYANEASKHGDLLFSFKSITHIIVVSITKKDEQITKNNNKIFSLTDNIGIGISGIIGDGRILYELIESKSNEYQLGNNLSVLVSHLAFIISRFFHTNTLYIGSRPLGINVLIAGYDKNGSNIYQINTEGIAKKCYGIGIGKNAETYKNIVEKFFNHFEFSSIDELVFYSILFINKNNNNFFIDARSNIFLIGKKFKSTVLNLKVFKFIIRLFFSIKLNLNQF